MDRDLLTPAVRHGRLASFHFEIVKGCQLQCIGCPISTLLPKIERVAVDVFEQCLRNVDVRSVDTLSLFNYGEPLLHDDLPGILECIPRQSWTVGEVEISTNAQRVDWAQVEEALRLKVLTRVVVSCDGDSTPASYEALRPPGKWERLIEFLHRMRELRDRVDPSLQLMTRTIVPDWADRARWDALLLPLGWTPEYRPFFYLPESAQNATGRAIVPGKGVCFFVANPANLYVDSSGTVVPCCAHPHAGAWGSLRTQTYREILASAERARFVDGLAQRRREMGVCASCEFGPADAPGPALAALLPALMQKKSRTARPGRPAEQRGGPRRDHER